MSSKKRKPDNQNWYICDICKSVLHVKDAPVHKEKSCVVNAESLLHPFIKNGVLFTAVEVCNTDDVPSLQSVPMERHNDFILVSISALKFMKVPIGDPVIIYPEGGDICTPFVKKVWPITGKNHFVSYLTKTVISLNSLNSARNVSIYPLQGHIKVAKRVAVECITGNHASNDMKFLIHLKEQNVNNIISRNNKIIYSLYGKTFIFKIVHIESLDEKFISDSNRISDSESEMEFFIISEDTVLKATDDNNGHPHKETVIKEIGGLNDTVRDLEEIISWAIHNKKSPLGLHVNKGVLIFGPGGTGKTTLIEALSQKFNVGIVRIDSSQIFSKYLGAAERQLQTFFEKAIQLSPSFVLIDELDILCPKATDRNEQSKRIIATLSVILDKLHSTENASVVVFATTSRISDVHESLRRPGRFGREIEIHVPNALERREILKIYLRSINHDLREEDVKDISDSSHGFVGADLVSLVSKAHLHWYRNKMTDKVTIDDFRWGLSKIKPSAMREVLIEIPNVQWSDIGGQEELKLKLKQSVEWPLKYEDSFRRLGIIPPRGLLMFGPPGCSKTMIAKALATESKLNFISVKGPELFSKWVGESERAVREVFRRARQVAPSIVFFDEMDAIGGERNASSGGANVEERVLAQLLTELDGVEPLGNVTVIGATNRLDRIDPALLRPGRFDRVVYVPLPDDSTRRQIFSIQFRKTPVATDVDLEELVNETRGYSGAEIVAVCHEAALKALEDNLGATFVLRKHFMSALKMIVPRTPQSLIEMYEKHLHS